MVTKMHKSGMYVILLTPLRVARFFDKVDSLLHPPLQSLPSFPSSLSSSLHITLPPYLSLAHQSDSARFLQLFLQASYNYLARSFSPLLGLPFPPFIPFLSIHPSIPSLFFCCCLCLLYLPFFPLVLSPSLVSSLFVSSHFLPLPSLSIDFSVPIPYPFIDYQPPISHPLPHLPFLFC